jgi:hypothetical protein
MRNTSPALMPAEEAQLRIAKQSLRMNAQFARWTGMSHEEAVRLIRTLAGHHKRYRVKSQKRSSGVRSL